MRSRRLASSLGSPPPELVIRERGVCTLQFIRRRSMVATVNEKWNSSRWLNPFISTARVTLVAQKSLNNKNKNKGERDWGKKREIQPVFSEWHILWMHVKIDCQSASAQKNRFYIVDLTLVQVKRRSSDRGRPFSLWTISHASMVQDWLPFGPLTFSF